MRDKTVWSLCAAFFAIVVWQALPRPSAVGQAVPPATATQSALGPGLYVFQTRTRGSSCGDSERDGYVMSYFAAINGIPGSTTMIMELVNTPHFTTWNLQISPDNTLTGKSRIGTSATAPDAQFSVKR
ncbi:MAG: hypothetical protein JWN04_1353, partial [Myxococcaceae bacterium]|nr:hypothetical protein [Myxococcaceae bacterium]